MTTHLDLSSDNPARALLIAVVLALLPLAWRMVRAPHLARIGLRNVFRARLRATLITFGLMLATTFVASALVVDDTIVLAVKKVAVISLGRVDEEVLGGVGPLGIYPTSTGSQLYLKLKNDPSVAGVEPALALPNMLVVDETARQVRGGVMGLGLVPDHAGPLGDLRTTTGNHSAPVGQLQPDEAYLNANAGELLGARPGDTLYLYSAYWSGHRYRFRVRDIVSGGPLGDRPSIVLPLDTLQTLLGVPAGVNRIYIANTGDGLSGVGASDHIATRVESTLSPAFRVSKVKQAGVQYALQAQDVFTRIVTLYTLFALSIGLLLIFLIFALLASERRGELGMARTLGMHRSQVVWMLLLEGAAYDLAAAAPGVLSGLGLGVAIVALVTPALAHLGLPLHADIEVRSIILAFCLGLLFTLATIVVAAWTVSRMTVAAALRGIPEPPPEHAPLLAEIHSALIATALALRAPTAALKAWSNVVWGITWRGMLLLLGGALLMRWAFEQQSGLTFSLGLSATLAGVVLTLRWLVLTAVLTIARGKSARGNRQVAEHATRSADRVSALLIGAGLTLYWSLPFDTLDQLGLPHFSGDVDVFFMAGIMMVLGVVLAIAPNLDVALAPFKWLATRAGRARHVLYIALIYPSHQRFRTGIGLALFSLVCFTMVVMACISASASQRYGNLSAQAGGFEIIGQPLFTPVGGVPATTAAIRHAAPTQAQDITAIAAATPVPLGVIQPGVHDARWGLYPGAALQGAFLRGTGLPLVARASNYTSDDAVWQAVREHPGMVVVDAGALSARDAAVLGIGRPAPVSAEQFVAPPIASGLLGLSSLEALLGRVASQEAQRELPPEMRALINNPSKLAGDALHIHDLAAGPGVIAPTTLWIGDLRGGEVRQVTVIGVVENSRGQRYGLLGSPDTFAPIEHGLSPFTNAFYYFQLAPHADAHADARAIGSALLDHGFETSVIEDLLVDVNGPRVFASRVLVGLVGLTLLVGLAALAVTGLRSVVERRQQVGMLRALGYHQADVRMIFIIESVLVGMLGAGLGTLLGLVLCRNVFAVDFFARFQSGIALVIPWNTLALICLAALSVSVLAALLPSWQASRIAPADALRYE